MCAFILSPPLAHRFTRNSIDFNCTVDALRIGGLQTLCRDGVKLCQLRVQIRPAMRFGLRVNLGANRRVGFGQFSEWFKQCLDIQHRPTDQYGQIAPRVNLVYQARGIGGKLRRAVRFGWLNDVNQMVRAKCAFSQCRFCCADVHATIHQSRIHADDFNWARLCECQSQCGFA